MIKGIHHAAISTANLDRMVAFYRDVVGFQEAEKVQWADNEIIDELIGLKRSKARQVMLRAGNVYLELFEYTSPAAREAIPLRPCDRGYTHICLDVEDIEKEYERLVGAGMKFNCSPVDFGGLKSTYGKDPDGNIVEIQELTEPHHRLALGVG